MAEYYADLNPRYGARYERRWAVFNRDTRHPVYGMHYTTREAAERNAAKLTEQEREEPATLDTPWGPATRVTDIGAGILYAATGSHGGYFVPPALNTLVPASWRAASFKRLGERGWYEEDRDWCLVALTFPTTFPAHAAAEARAMFATLNLEA